VVLADRSTVAHGDVAQHAVAALRRMAEDGDFTAARHPCGGMSIALAMSTTERHSIASSLCTETSPTSAVRVSR